jgi:23S rRNA pseudouridine2605 synthase
MVKKSKKKNETGGTELQAPETKVKAKPRAKKKAKIEDPVGDVSDGEGQVALESGLATGQLAEEHGSTSNSGHGTISRDAQRPDTEGGGGFNPRIEPINSARTLAQEEPASERSAADFSVPADAEATLDDRQADDPQEDEPEFKPRPPAKLERLQKILAQAGVASRRKAEEMIEQGRVQVNGKVIAELGTKADAGRDHIRVDGKLLQGAERLRYFVLNKPRGFVTTVKDPEGRPTVMQFFDKMRERLYPVGRLDYMSEGLLLVTNDGELANRLTRASAGVEKTYLVKVAGIPSEAELDQLRSGVSIERGKPGSPKIRTSPARIRQVRQGDNPWYEVVLIEGRNRELRKMFEEVGHFVEKIRRVGYGPLVLDQEPGNLRELEAEELALLRKAANGTLRTPKSKDVRRRNLLDAGQLPTVSPRFSSPRPAKTMGTRPFVNKSFDDRPAAGPKDYSPKRFFAIDRPAATGGPTHPGGPARPAGKDFRPSRLPDAARPSGTARFSGQGYRPAGRPSARPAWQKDDRRARPPQRFERGSAGESRPATGESYGARPYENKPFAAKPNAGRAFGSKPPSNRPFGDRPPARPYADRPAATKPFEAKHSFSKSTRNEPARGKPAWSKSGPKDRPPFKQPSAPRPQPRERDEDLGPARPPSLYIEEIHGLQHSAPSRPSSPRPGGSRHGALFARSARPSPDRPRPDRPGQVRPNQAGPNQGRPSPARPFRGEGGLARPFTTSSGKPRPGGARPSSRPGGSGYKVKAFNPKQSGKSGGKRRG